LTQTSFLAERAIAYVPAVGVKLMALALVISIGEQIFTTYTVSPEPTWQESCGLLVAAIVFLMLALKIPAIAAAQITGSPQLNAGSAASSVVGLAATAGGLALAGRWAAGGLAAGAGASAARGAAGLRAQMGGRGPGGGGSGRSPGGGLAGGSAPSVASVVARAKSSFSPPPSSPPSPEGGGSGEDPPTERAPSRRTGAGRTAAGAAATPWRADAAGRPAGMPQIHPPSDDA